MMGLLHAPHDFAADAFRGRITIGFGQFETLVRIVACIGRPQGETAPRDHADAAPVAVRDLEHLLDDFAGMHVALGLHRARIRVLDLGATGLELLHAAENSLEDVHRLKPRDDDGCAEFTRNRAVFHRAHDGAHMTRGEKALHPVVRCAEDGAHRRRHQHVRGQDGEILHALVFGQQLRG